jgi:Putative zinc-finger
MAGHDEYLELCAVSVSGELTDEERNKLDEHLSACSSCRIAFSQYRATIATVIPRLVSELPSGKPSNELPWSEAEAEKAFFERLEQEDRFVQSPGFHTAAPSTHLPARNPPTFARSGQFGMLYAAAILLFVALTICAYRVGERRGVESAVNGQPRSGDPASTKTELSDAGHDREVLLSEIAARDKAIVELKQRIAREAARRGNESANQVQLAIVPGAASADSSVDPKTGSGSATQVEQLQSQLNAQQAAKTDQVTRAAALEMKVAALSKQLQEQQEESTRQNAAIQQRDELLQQRDGTIAQQQDLLSHDRDIRDLMSARDLYIAEVYDVAKTGRTNKPYGRIFYTKGKSLLFYAYDLDQQPGLRKASAFQVWGRRGVGQDQALNLGILYEDSVANKRWVVRSEDAKTLEQIDAIFVTVEPNGGSERPSGKPLLFAYLRIHPNHP